MARHCPACSSEYQDHIGTCTECGSETLPGDLPGFAERKTRKLLRLRHQAARWMLTWAVILASLSLRDYGARGIAGRLPEVVGAAAGGAFLGLGAWLVFAAYQGRFRRRDEERRE